MIEHMERAAGRQRHYSKALLAALGAAVAALYAYFAVHQLLYPFQTAHQARFAGHLRDWQVSAADLGGAAMALLAVGAVVSFPGHQAHGSWRSLLAASALLATLEAGGSVAEREAIKTEQGRSRGRHWLQQRPQPHTTHPQTAPPHSHHSFPAVYWSVAIRRVAAASAAPLASLWRLLWLPTVPPTFVMLIALAIQVMRSTAGSLEALRRARYDYKRA